MVYTITGGSSMNLSKDNSRADDRIQFGGQVWILEPTLYHLQQKRSSQQEDCNYYDVQAIES